MAKSSISSFSEEISRIMPYLMKGVFKHNLNIMGFGKITIPQCLTLDLLDFCKFFKMKDIARDLNVSLPAATGLINRLHNIGMVKRAYDKKDRRIIYISLTPKGKRIVKKVRAQRKKIIENLFSKLTTKERSTYIRILKKLKKAIINEKLEK